MVRRALYTVLRYLPGLAALALLVWGSIALRRRTGFNLDVTSLIILTMIATAWYAGRGPGLAVAIAFEVLLDLYGTTPADPTRATIIAFNRVFLFVSIVFFASARKSAEERLRQQQDKLEESLARERRARHDAEQANVAKDEFLATVSHELRTPLNAIQGWAALLARHRPDEDTFDRAVRTIDRNARAQTQIVEDILDMSRIAAGGVRLDPRPMQLAPVVDDALESVRPLAAANGIEITSELDSGLIVSGDVQRLRQVATNLVSNAIKFTPAGGLVTVRLRRVGDQAELTVTDTGIGIAPDFFPNLFERFRRADASMTRDRGGLGLGLAIVRHLVEAHGGTITAQSAGDNKGAVFTVTLPLSPAALVT